MRDKDTWRVRVMRFWLAGARRRHKRVGRKDRSRAGRVQGNDEQVVREMRRKKPADIAVSYCWMFNLEPFLDTCSC